VSSTPRNQEIEQIISKEMSEIRNIEISLRSMKESISITNSFALELSKCDSKGEDKHDLEMLK